MDSKTSLFNRAKEFIHSSKLEDLNIFSKQYFHSVISPYYSSNTENDNYSIICIDFNKLNDINNLYGYQTGDKVIHQSLSLLQSVLPVNSICARFGGDEFLFIIENCPPDNIDSIIHKMHSILEENAKDILSCSVTAYGVHSSEQNSISEMIAEADLKIIEQKNNYNQESSYSKWGILEQKLNQNLTSFFKSLRLFNEPIDVDFLRKLYVHAISSSSDILEKDFTPKKDDFKEPVHSSSLSDDELDSIYKLFLQHSPSKEEIEKIDYSTYNSLLEDLIRNPITGNFSGNYFKQYLLNDCNKTFYVKYLSTALVKLCNSTLSHNATDIILNKMGQDFLSFCEKEGISFITDNFSKESGNYFIDNGGGDYLVAFSSPEDEKSNVISHYIFSKLFNFSNLENILKLTCTDNLYEVNKHNFEDVLNQLSNYCKKEKDSYRMDIMTEPVIKEALNHIIYNSIEYYMENIPNSNDIKQKSKLLNLIGKSMLDVSHTLNEKQSLNTKKQKNKEEEEEEK